MSEVRVDGRQGEGGGQILRSSLALSLVTGRPFVIEHIRAGRKKPGLLRQHLTAVNAATVIGAAVVEGAALGSSRVAFAPQGIHPGAHRFAVGSAGSACLVLQSVLPALLAADGPSEVRLEGGTHNPSSPPFDFLAKSYLPLVSRMGPAVSLELERAGFFPRGGGRMIARVTPGGLGALELERPGARRRARVTAIVADLPARIGRREVDVVGEALGIADRHVEQRPREGPGNALFVELEHEALTLMFTAFGRKGVPAERVAANLASEVQRWQDADVAVDEHLADQLLLPMALGEGGRFTTLEPTPHTTTHADVIAQFLERRVSFEALGRGRTRVTVA
ncbi:MAG: RNA 3'-terminal phosphate cyclase [Sandaracinaceae bacterium]